MGLEQANCLLLRTVRQEYSINGNDGVHVPELSLEPSDTLCLRLLLMHLGQQLRDVRDDLNPNKGTVVRAKYTACGHGSECSFLSWNEYQPCSCVQASTKGEGQGTCCMRSVNL